MQAVIDFFSYINGLGASVMMPIILTIFGVILGAKFGKALRGGLTVGVGFIGLNLAVGLIGHILHQLYSRWQQDSIYHLQQ